jgi:nitroimidazol reductase NimA-like FMN-containing flavoprotein (pyridoxamine 5'-phosphate oxidase superfamily)
MKNIAASASGTSSRPPRYAEAVPAALRTLDVVEFLQRVPSGLNLSEISRALQISPSSLLAILRTLASRGYVERDAASGRYRVGPRFAALAADSAATRALDEAADAVVALARASMIGARAEDASERQKDTLVALGLAGRRLSGLLLGETASFERTSAGVAPEPVWRAEASGPLTTDELDRFLAGDLIATLSCVKDSGYPYSVPVWYQWEEGRFWIVSRSRAEWALYIERNPRVSLAISEHHPPLRRVLVEGKAEPVSGPDSVERADQLTARMAQRYLGPSASSYLEATALPTRRVFAIVPEKLVTWHGLASHPRYRATHQQAMDDTGVA